MLGFVPFIVLSAISAPPSLDDQVAKVVKDMTFSSMTVSLMPMDCGSPNAAYMPGLRTIVVCNELVAKFPGSVTFIVAHEMAHAIIDQLDLPITGSEEAAADELAAVYSLSVGHPERVLAAAVFFDSLPGGHQLSDPHPDPQQRMWTLRCYEDGARAISVIENCSDIYTHAVRTWGRLLNGPKYAP